MKVAFVAGTLGRGGAETQLLHMLRALQLEGIQTRVLTLTEGDACEVEIENLGVPVEYVGSNRLKRLWTISANLRKDPVDFIQSAHFFANIYVALAGRVTGIMSIGAVRGDLGQAMAANGAFGHWQLKLPKHMIANSQSAVSEAIERGIESSRIDFVRNVVDIEQPSAEKNSRFQGRLNVLFAARLVPLKRPEIFLRLAARLLSELPDIELNFQIAGDGPIRKQLETTASELDLLPNSIEFLGELGQMDTVYRNADILVLTSEHEGTPNVVLEAMSFGMPVVATKVGGVAEIVPQDCGMLVDADDSEGLFDAARTLIINGELRAEMGKKAQEFVRKNHSIGHLQERLPEIYSRLKERIR